LIINSLKNSCKIIEKMSFNIYLGIFIVAALAIIGGGSAKLFMGGMGLAGFLFLVGSIAIFAVFGIKWFGTKSGIFSETPVSWPPVINTCPDYLVYYGRKMPDGTTQDSCIDLIGVSKNGAFKVFPDVKKTSNVVPTGDEFYFSLATKSSDAGTKNAELCARAMAAGLTWEGITNGESCITPAGPAAPSSGGSGSSNCNSSSCNTVCPS
jgi:hypothetical protein